MLIQWFPGHMTKSLRMMQEQSKVCDVFVYVLDARAPFSSLNPQFINLIGDKPIIYVINKSDMAESSATDRWVKYFSQFENSRVMTLNATQSKAGNKIVELMNDMLSDRLNSNKEKGINFIFRAMVLGVPNCGKSTIINNLCGKARAITGDKAGVTRSKQWVKLSKTLEMMDSPGTLWPSFKEERVAKNLAYIGSIKGDILDIERLAMHFIEDIIRINKTAFINRYQIVDIDELSTLEIFEFIAKRRGCIFKKDDYDYTRCANLIFNDYRKGLLGKITLEQVNDIEDYVIEEN